MNEINPNLFCNHCNVLKKIISSYIFFMMFSFIIDYVSVKINGDHVNYMLIVISIRIWFVMVSGSDESVKKLSTLYSCRK